MRIDGKRHSHLAECEFEPVVRLKPSIGIKHFNLSLIRKVYFRFITHNRYDFPFYAHACVANLKPALVYLRFVFIFGAYSAVNLRHIFRYGFSVHLLLTIRRKRLRQYPEKKDCRTDRFFISHYDNVVNVQVQNWDNYIS